MQRSLLPLLQRMPRLRGSIGILLALMGPVSVPGAVGFGDEVRSSSFSEGMLSSRPAYFMHEIILYAIDMHKK